MNEEKNLHTYSVHHLPTFQCLCYPAIVVFSGTPSTLPPSASISVPMQLQVITTAVCSCCAFFDAVYATYHPSSSSSLILISRQFLPLRAAPPSVRVRKQTRNDDDDNDKGDEEDEKDEEDDGGKGGYYCISTRNRINTGKWIKLANYHTL